MKDDLGAYSKHSRQQMKMIWTWPSRFFEKEYIVTMKKKIAVIVLVHTVE